MNKIKTDNLPNIISVESLDINALSLGRIYKLNINLMEDGMGRPIAVPVLIARGTKPGPVFGITAAVHGNELNGIPVIHRLFSSLEPNRIRGTIVAVVVVNVLGFLAHSRTFTGGTDLNHIMPGVAGGNSYQVFAHRLVERIVNRFEFLVDLHTASFGRINSLYVRANMKDPATASMAELLRPQIIVHNPPSDGTLRGAATELEIPAVTVEVGNPLIFQADYIRSSLKGLRRVMVSVGVLPKRKIMKGEISIHCSKSYWLYTDRGGLLRVLPKVTNYVPKGEIIAHLTDIFGTVIREYRAPESGVVIGKSVNPVGETGARILHLGILSESGVQPDYIKNRK